MWPDGKGKKIMNRVISQTNIISGFDQFGLVTVCRYEMTTGKRVMTYGRTHIFNAMKEIIKAQNLGQKFLILNADATFEETNADYDVASQCNKIVKGF